MVESVAAHEVADARAAGGALAGDGRLKVCGAADAAYGRAELGLICARCLAQGRHLVRWLRRKAHSVVMRSVTALGWLQVAQFGWQGSISLVCASIHNEEVVL